MKNAPKSAAFNKPNDEKKDIENKEKSRVAFDEMGDGLEKQDSSEKEKISSPAGNMGDTKDFFGQVLALSLVYLSHDMSSTVQEISSEGILFLARGSLDLG